jgi:tRNA(Ile)-lysidine synthase
MSERAGDADLRRRFLLHIADAALFDDTDHLLVAVSGGLDSVVLLHLLRFHTHQRITVAHYDHALRTTSAGDALWLRGLCVAWNVALHSARAATPPRSEADARAQRYDFLQRIADNVGATRILTAHHADDQAETVLFRIMRGTGIAGLAGVAQRRGNIVRPLLPFTRAEIRAYARAHRLQWREDESNRDVRYARNRIRHDVLPLLERNAPGITRRIAALAADAGAAERASQAVIADVVQDVVIARHDAGFALARDRVLAYHPHVRARVMRHLVQRLGGRPDRAATRSLLAFAASGASGTGIELPGRLRLDRELDQLLLHRPDGAPARPDAPLPIPGTGPGQGELVAGGRRYAVRWGLASTQETGAQGAAARFDPSSLRFPLTLRAWRAGDRIRLGYGSKKLKKLFLERRVARARRARTPVLTDEGGQVLWVTGYAQAAGTEAGPGADPFEIVVVDVDTE